jgi:hypothetical protein
MTVILTHDKGEFGIIGKRSSLKPWYSFRLYSRKSMLIIVLAVKDHGTYRHEQKSRQKPQKDNVYLPSKEHQYIIMCFSWQ